MTNSERRDVPGEIGSLERIVQSRLGDRDDVRAVLEELAHRGGGAWPPTLSDADQQTLITDGPDLAVVENGMVRFTDSTMREYLAACHLHRRHPGGPRWWQPRTRRYLAPRDTWPWPDHGMLLFLTALWHSHSPATVDRLVRRLLRERYRNPNVRFVVELLRRDLIPGSGLRDHTAEVLRGVLQDGGQDEETWRTMVECLHLLDPREAVVGLEKLLRTPSPTVSQVRRVAAAEELARYDPARGAEALRTVADSVTGPPQDCLDAALRIARIDGALGARTLRLLAHDRRMGDLRVQTALHEGSPELLRELVEPRHSVPDDGRVRLATALLGQDTDAGIEALERIAETAADERTLLRVAETVHPWHQDMALRLANDVAWAAAGTTDSWLRLDAVLLIGTFDSARKIPELHRLSRDRSVVDEVRVRAATTIVEVGGPTTALVELSEDRNLDRACLARVAETLGRIEPVSGARAFIVAAKRCPATATERPKMLRKAHSLDAAVAFAEITRFTKESRVPARTRYALVDAVAPTSGRQRTIDLFAILARDSDTTIAEKAARKVMGMDLVTGQRLLGGVADRPGGNAASRLKAALDAGGYGKSALVRLANTAKPPAVRRQAATALYAIDRAAGEAALRALARTSRIDTVRVEAALALPGRAVVPALLDITKDRREKEGIRVEAALKARERDEKRGRAALVNLSTTRTFSRATQDLIRRELER